MGTQPEYSAVANAILKLIQADVAALPGWEQGWVPPAMEAPLAGAAAKLAVDTLDAYRANQAKGQA